MHRRAYLYIRVCGKQHNCKIGLRAHQHSQLAGIRGENIR